MKRVLYLLLFLLCFTGIGFVSCDENGFTDPSVKGRLENVSFAKDTFYFSEKDGKVQVALLASRYLNYAANLKIDVVPTNVPDSVLAVEKKHFFIDIKEVKIPLGETKASLNIRLNNDTLINPDRVFTLRIVSAEGGGVVPPGKEQSVIIIRNDDFIPEASIVFDSAVCRVPEECGTVNIPFRLTKPAKGEVKVTFAAKKGNYSAHEREHYSFVATDVILPEGETKGFVSLNIINNLDVYDTRFDMVVSRVEGAAIGQDSICDIRIINDDLDRVISFNVAAMEIGEDSGKVSFSLKATGGTDSRKKITGRVMIDSLFGCTPDDITILNPEFSTDGDDMFSINFELKDNNNFGEWGVRFTIGDLENARLGTKRMLLNVKDDERMIAFEEVSCEVLEPEEPGIDYVQNVKLKLLGGTLNQDVRLTLMSAGDADPAQYEFAQVVTILAGTSELDIPVKIKKHSSKNTRTLVIKATGANYPKVIFAGDEQTQIDIINTDKVVKFKKQEVMVLASGIWIVPLEIAPFTSPIKVVFEVKTPSSRFTVGTISEVIIPAGGTSGNVKIDIKDKNPGTLPDQRVVIQIKEVLVNNVSREDVLEDDSRVCKIGIKMDLNKLLGDWGGTQQRTYTNTTYTYGTSGQLAKSVATVISDDIIQFTGMVSTPNKSGGSSAIYDHVWRIQWVAAKERFEFIGSDGTWEKDFLMICNGCKKAPCTCANPAYFLLTTTSDNKINLRYNTAPTFDVKWRGQTAGVQTIKQINITSKNTYNLTD